MLDETDQYVDAANLAYEPIGQCIYCGATDRLTNEHIIPFGLSGPMILPQSSCQDCARLTGRVEGQVLRGPMRAVRVLKGMKSRSNHRGAPKSYALIVLRDGEEELIRVPAEEHPVLLGFPVFREPAIIDPEGYQTGIRFQGMVVLSFSRAVEEVKERLNVDDFRVTLRDRPVEFARMLGKIGYAYAVAEGFVTVEDGPHPIAKAIVGQALDIGRYVGTLRDPVVAEPGRLHRIGLHVNDKGIRFASVKLFANSLTPQYGVVLEPASME